MNAIQFDVSVPRYLAGKLLGALHQPFYWSGLSCLRYGQVPESTLLLTHRFRLDEYRQAFRSLAAKGANRVLKAVFSDE
jgi:threonine dehydrogenase-like Zn-dependent dehydrogenase